MYVCLSFFIETSWKFHLKIAKSRETNRKRTTCRVFLLLLDQGASELQLAPSGKILYLYPMTEEALGLDMLLHPQSGRASYNSIRQQDMDLQAFFSSRFLRSPPVERPGFGFFPLLAFPFFWSNYVVQMCFFLFGLVLSPGSLCS